MYVEVSAVHAFGSTGSLGEFPPCEMQGLESYWFFSKMGFFIFFFKSGYYCVAFYLNSQICSCLSLWYAGIKGVYYMPCQNRLPGKFFLVISRCGETG